MAVVEVQLSVEADVASVMREFRVGSACGLANANVGRILFGSWSGEDVVVVKKCGEASVDDLRRHGAVRADVGEQEAGAEMRILLLDF